MSENNSNNDKQPKKSLNFYWIYAVIGAVLIGMMMFQKTGGGKSIDYTKFIEMARDTMVSQVVVHDLSQAEVWLNEKGIKAHQDDIPEDGIMKGLGGKSAHYIVGLGDPTTLEQVKQLSDERGFSIEYRRTNEFGQTLITWIIFIGILIAVWLVLMRRLGSGPAGGGQIFNIGKSRAQLFEKGKGT